MKLWFYEKDGQRLGEISSEQMAELLKNNTINGNTLVWSQGFTQWVPLTQTELVTHLMVTNTPPALPSTKISNLVIWILALVPLIAVVTNLQIIFVVAANVILCILDEKNLKKAGVDTTQFGNMVFFIPVYLWKRAKTLEQTPSYFWVWLGLFILSNFNFQQ